MTRPQSNAIRVLRGLRTQQEFAQAVGVTRAVISRWENGGEVSLMNARRLVELGLDPAYVLPSPTVAPVAGADLSRRTA
jgi:transcriptional regulator with XRE-family HTH domain